MDSNANDLNCRESIRWGDDYKVYTRKRRRKTLENTNTTTNVTADDVAVIPFRDSSRKAEVVVDVSNDECTRGSELRDPTNVENHRDETQSCNLEVENNNNNGYVVKPVVISRIQDSDEHTRGSARDGELREGSCSRDVENETQSCNLEVENNNGYVVKPVISRIQDRIRINLKGVRFKDEIRELSTSLESELDQVRSLVKEVEAKQFQLTAYRSTSINDGSVTTVPGGSISSYSHSQYNMDNGVIKNRSLVRINSDVRSVGHIGSRPFQRPSFLIVENSNGSSDFMEKDKRIPKANQYYRNSEFLLGKDRLPPESNKRMRPNGSGKKHSGDSENGFGFGFDKHRLQVFRNCGSLLERLMKHQHGWVFNEPVNAKALGLHDYHVIVTHPMDLGTIKTRLSQNWYKSPREFAEDVRLVFYNAMTYNPKGQDVHVMAEHLSEIFEERWAVIEAEYNSYWRHQTYHDAGTPTPTSRRTSFAPSFLHTPVASHSLAPIARQLQTLDRSESMTRPVNPRMKTSNIVHVARTPIPKKPKAKDPNKRDMTYEEKQKLSTNLQGLPTEKLDAIVQIIKKRNSTLTQDNDEIEVDIDSVDAETLWELDRFVTNFKKSFSKYKRKAELALRAREVAAQTARIVNLTSEVADAPRENGTGEKDTTPATLAEGGRPLGSASRSSSSSSSSSDSGSSSSDSDSDSSSASGSEAAHSPRT
ncbi:transcription factor GTE4-like [Lycium barbarum]|uniref:transcription factor GTE4-like n=1 Tax=Lycium barbarum TaxID=112863 RepID=UPI00293E8088|nr:transcription factor GTE4-like [Lycium barbarum]XP_060190084.1 transcription factor GTE4-like [Lycium barbarum]